MADRNSLPDNLELPGVRYEPKRVVATFVDEYGEERIIHAPKGRSLRLAKTSETPVMRMNRAAAVLIGRRIREARLARHMTMQELGERAGLRNGNQKAYINSLERATRQEGMRLGTLFAIAIALDCEVADLLPSTRDVQIGGGVASRVTATLEVA